MEAGAELVKKFRKKQESRGSGPQGEISLSGDRIIVKFSFSPQRVAAIKAIPGARFHKESKHWSVPAQHLARIESSPLFRRGAFVYRLDGGASAGNPPDETKAAALTRIAADPFCVEADDIEAADLDVVVCQAEKLPALRLRMHYGSPAKEIVDAVPGAHYIRSEQLYSLPAERLAGLLMALRDRRLSFAVERAVSEKLKLSAERRAQIVQGRLQPSLRDLQECLLAPYITVASGGAGFSFCCYTTEQLRECFPAAKTYAERRASAERVSPAQLLALLSRVRRLPYRVWQTADTAQYLEAQRGNVEAEYGRRPVGFADEFLAAALPEICWVAGEQGGAGVLLAKLFYEVEFEGHAGNPLEERPKEILSAYPEAWFFPLGDSEVAEVREEVAQYLAKAGLSAAATSASFERFWSDLAERKKLLDRQRHYHALRDLPFDSAPLSNPEIGAQLFPHQRVAVSWLLDVPRAFLGDDMGLGKTLSVLTAFDALRAQGKSSFLLVVCPNSLTRNWLREAGRWFPALKLGLLPQDKRGKLMFLKKLRWGAAAFDGLAVNYETVRLDYVYPELMETLRDRQVLLCLDESQRVKTPASKTFKALCAVAPIAERRVLLSGTPTPKDITDIWAQMRLLDDGARFGRNFYDWLPRVADLGNQYSDFAVTRFKPEGVREAALRVREVLLRRRKEEVVNLPEKTFAVRDVEMTGDQLKRYEEIRKELLMRVTSLTGDTFVKQISSILEEYLRAVQISSNPRLIDEQWKGEPAKFLELDEIVNEIVSEREEKIVVWTNYLRNTQELTKRYERFGAAAFSGEVPAAERARLLDEFQNGERLRVLVAIPAAGGVGITLTAAQTAVYVDKTWNAEHWMQSIDRIHRIGQRGTVRILSLQASPVDALIAANLRRKERDQALVLGDRTTRMEKTPRLREDAPEYPSREELLDALQPAR